jgi:hypothetical protein
MPRPRRDIEDSLLDESWEIDCTDMRLVQNDSEQPTTFNGRGFLRQVEGGTVSFRLYANVQEN